jgi:glycerol-3-phosphate acyltransferase PlsY
MLTATGPLIELILCGLLGYLIGAIPTGFLITRALYDKDVREYGSSHTGGLNVSRLAGLWAGVLTSLLDMALGATAVLGATLLTDQPWAGPAAGVLAVIGHDWSVYIRLGGGIGLSKLAGALLATLSLPTLEAMVLVALFWLMLVKLLHIHRARSTIAAMVVVGPLLWALGMPIPGIVLGVLGGIVVVIKTLPDWNRDY